MHIDVVRRLRAALRIGAVGVASAAASLGAANAATVDLRTWSAESYPAVSGFGAGVWTPSATGASVLQSVNGQPTLFVSDFDTFGTDVRGTIRVNPGGDDDYVGFALGFSPGDTTAAGADYLLVDWKQGTQAFNFGAPSNTPGSTAARGLAVSRVTGVPTADEFWGHVNFDTDTAGAVTELARGATLGSTGWAGNQDYVFRFVFQPTRLQVYVNDGLEMSVDGNFANGRMAFYNFSQSGVTYSAFTVDPAPPVPEPGTWALSLLGLGLLAWHRRGRRA